MTQGPDGAYYFNDWVFSSYPIHGRGRLWKLEIDRDKANWVKPTSDPMTDAAQLAKDLRAGRAQSSVRRNCWSLLAETIPTLRMLH
jgi:hypothetical protein